MPKLYLSFLFLILPAGCRTAAPSTTSAPAPSIGISTPEAATTPGIRTANRIWLLTPDNRSLSYSSVTKTVLRPETSPSTASDSVFTQISLDLAVSRTVDGLLLQGTIRAESVTGSIPTPTSSEIHEVPKEFTGTLKGGDLFLKPFTGEPGRAVYDCTESRPTFASALQRALVIPPDRITAATVWSDTVTILTCLGTIPVRSTTIRSYRSPREVNLNSRRSILFQRHDTITLQGAGSAGQHRLFIKADGSGTGSTSLDANTGTLVEATGHQNARVQITSSGRQQVFLQSTEERITQTGKNL